MHTAACSKQHVAPVHPDGALRNRERGAEAMLGAPEQPLGQANSSQGTKPHQEEEEQEDNDPEEGVAGHLPGVPAQVHCATTASAGMSRLEQGACGEVTQTHAQHAMRALHAPAVV